MSSRESLVAFHKDHFPAWVGFCMTQPVRVVMVALTTLYGHSAGNTDVTPYAWVPILFRPTLHDDIDTLLDAFNAARCGSKGWRLPAMWELPIHKYRMAPECLNAAVVFVQDCVYGYACAENAMACLLLCVGAAREDMDVAASVYGRCVLPSIFQNPEYNHTYTIMWSLAPTGGLTMPDFCDTEMRITAFRVFWLAVIFHGSSRLDAYKMLSDDRIATVNKLFMKEHDLLHWFCDNLTKALEMEDIVT